MHNLFYLNTEKYILTKNEYSHKCLYKETNYAGIIYCRKDESFFSFKRNYLILCNGSIDATYFEIIVILNFYT